jgi:uncharacterized protein (TIGR02145 family)
MNGASSSNLNPSGVQGICPDGWHIPSQSEFQELVSFVGSDAGRKLKSCRNSGTATGIPECDNQDHPRWNYLASNYGWDTFDFSALPGGYRSTLIVENYFTMGDSAEFWTSTEVDATNAYYYLMVVGGANFLANTESKTQDFRSIRCVKN